MLKKTWKIGQKIDELTVGQKLHLTETIEDKDLLLYLGLTNDNNPLYIQHDYTSETPYEKPVVPIIMLNGIVASAISKYLPGPGSFIVEQNLRYDVPVYHYETINFELEIKHIDSVNKLVEVQVQAVNALQQTVIGGRLLVRPPY